MDKIPQFMSLLNQLRLYQNRLNAEIDPLRGKGVVLYHLCHHGGAALSGELSRHLRISTPRMAAILSSLEIQGFISREKAKSDQRKVVVRATSKGQEYVRVHDQKELLQVQNLLEQLGPQDSETLLYSLQRVADILNSYDLLLPDRLTNSSEL